jgi:hypothetical protein
MTGGLLRSSRSLRRQLETNKDRRKMKKKKGG